MMLPEPFQIDLDVVIAGRTRNAVNDLGFLKKADEFPNHSGKSGTQDFRRPAPGTIAPMLRKPLDDVVVRLRDRDA